MNAVASAGKRPKFARGPRRKGTLEMIAGVRSRELGNTRDLHVYLPPSYQSSETRYPVVYLQDGQNLFDPALSFAGAWGADLAADAAARLGYEAIIVGVPNMGISRIEEYSPFVDMRVGGGGADRYLAFLINTVKHRVDAAYRTDPSRNATVIGGASMGALVSLYAFFRHPDVFGRVAAQSPSLWFADGIFFDYVGAAPVIPGRIFLDVGRREGERTVENAKRMHQLLMRKGYEDRVSVYFVEDRTGAHNEAAWGRRLKKALPYLLNENPS